MVLSLVAMVASGNRDVDVDAATFEQWAALAALIVMPLAAVAVGHCVSLMANTRRRWWIAIASIVIGVTADWWGDGLADILRDTATDLGMVVVLLLATGVGLGSVLAWCGRQTVRHLRSAAGLTVRALPVVLLTVLAFFNTTVWLIASDLDATRICLLLAFLSAIAIAFLVAGVRDALGLGVPTSTMAKPNRSSIDPVIVEPRDGLVQPLRRAERINVLMVAVTSYVAQLTLIAGVTGGLFFVLGLIVLNPAVLGRLTNGASAQSVLFDFTLPVSVAHVHVTLILTALTFMYVSVKAIGDAEYRRDFMDPLLAHMRAALSARHRYVALLR